MSKFTIGQKVTATDTGLTDHYGEVGEVIEVMDKGNPLTRVKFADGIVETFFDLDNELAPAEPAAPPRGNGADAGDDAPVGEVVSGKLERITSDHGVTSLGLYAKTADGTMRMFVEASAVHEHIATLQAELAQAREALQRCINADLTGYWSAEEVAKRFFVAYPGSE